MPNVPVTFSNSVADANQVSSSQSDAGKKILKEESTISQEKSKMETLEPVKRETNMDEKITVSDSSVASVHLAYSPLIRQLHSPPTTKMPPDTYNTVDSAVTSSGFASDKDSIDDMDGNMKNVCSNILSMSIHENQWLQNSCTENSEPVICQTSENSADTTKEVCIASVQSEFRLGMPTQVTEVDLHGIEDDLFCFDHRRVNNLEAATNRLPEYSHSYNPSKHSNTHSPDFSDAGVVGIDLDKQDVDRNSDLMVSTSNFPSGHPENINSSEVTDAESSNLFPSREKSSLLGRYEGGVGSGAVDMGESSIISNILSMEFDPWDESLTSPENLAKLLGETDKRQVSFGVPVHKKSQNSIQSRFSFAREGEHMNHVSDYGHSTDYYEQAFKQPLSGHGISSSNSFHLEKSVSRNGFPLFGGTEQYAFAGSHSHISSNKLSG